MKLSNLICLPQFDFAGTLYIVHYGLRVFSQNYQGTFFRNCLGDFLTLPVVLPILVNVQILLKCRKRLHITFIEILFYTILFSFVFEFFSPVLLNRGTASVFDCVAYFLGGTVLYFSQYLTKELS